jgi:hypothetical protein
MHGRRRLAAARHAQFGENVDTCTLTVLPLI